MRKKKMFKATMCYCPFRSLEIREKIIEKWHELWMNQGGSGFFADLLETAWHDMEKKETDNKKKNEFWKKVFLCEHCIGIALVLIWAVYFIVSQFGVCSKLVAVGWPAFLGVVVFLSAMTIWISAVTAKKIDIKKYQETWARHSTYRYRLEKEMLLYIYALEPYAEVCIDRKDAFMQNVIAILFENQSKFADNMETKERELMDIVDYIRFKSKEE